MMKKGVKQDRRRKKRWDKNSLFIVGSLNDINYMQFSKAYCETTVSLAKHSGNGSFRAT